MGGFFYAAACRVDAHLIKGSPRGSGRYEDSSCSGTATVRTIDASDIPQRLTTAHESGFVDSGAQRAAVSSSNPKGESRMERNGLVVLRVDWKDCRHSWCLCCKALVLVLRILWRVLGRACISPLKEDGLCWKMKRRAYLSQ